MKRRIVNILNLLLLAILFASCKQVVLRVDSIPGNTPKGQAIYVAGNFNNWDPGDQRYQLQLNKDSSYTIKLPPGFGSVEYKFTRGDWTTVEKDICGYEIGNRSTLLGESDTVSNSILSWGDLDPENCPRLTLVVDSLPANTPKDSKISVAGNFNSWNPDESTSFEKDSSTGKYLITIPRPPNFNELEFKITRGDLSTSESDEFGNALPSRTAKFGTKDTLKVNVDGWIDRPDKKGSDRVVLIIKSLPKNTPAGDDFYLISSLNDWTPGDKNYIFQKNRQGEYFFPMPRKKRILEYKITRGYWPTVEVDRFGNDIANRETDLMEFDTVYLSIQGWKDIPETRDYEVTVVLENLPETTPPNEDFYIAGNFNGWNPKRNRNKFEKDDRGRLLVNLRRDNYTLEFKITRGSWESIEVDQYGSDIPNRFYYYKDIDTIHIDVANWKDRPRFDTDKVTLVINKLPDNTPRLDALYLAPDFNGWNPEDKSQIFLTLPDGRPYIDIKKRGNSTSYKITRGGWGRVEVDEWGNEIPDRVINFGFADTVYIEVQKWRDFGGNY
ncbi:MAG: hypothetical protein R2764_12570 [Bacteroidales bacterium]